MANQAPKIEASELLELTMGAGYRDDLVDYDSIASIMASQGTTISRSIQHIEAVLVTGQPGRADTLETETICAKRAAAAKRA